MMNSKEQNIKLLKDKAAELNRTANFHEILPNNGYMLSEDEIRRKSRTYLKGDKKMLVYNDKPQLYYNYSNQTFNYSGNYYDFFMKEGFYKDPSFSNTKNFVKFAEGNNMATLKFQKPEEHTQRKAFNKESIKVLKEIDTSIKDDLKYLKSRKISKAIVEHHNFKGTIFIGNFEKGYSDQLLFPYKIKPEDTIDNIVGMEMKLDRHISKYYKTIRELKNKIAELNQNPVKTAQQRKEYDLLQSTLTKYSKKTTNSLFAKNTNRDQGLWFSNFDSKRNLDFMILVENPIDAMSHYALNKDKLFDKNILYIGTGGQLSEEQNNTIKQLTTEYSTKVVCAFDNDLDGTKYTQKILEKLNNISSNTIIKENEVVVDIKIKEQTMYESLAKNKFYKAKIIEDIQNNYHIQFATSKENYENLVKFISSMTKGFHNIHIPMMKDWNEQLKFTRNAALKNTQNITI